MMDKNQHLQMGFKHFSQQEFEKAAASFRAALELDPHFDLACNALTETYNKMGDLENALKMAKKLVELTPDDPIAHAALSRLYVQKGMIEEAEAEMAISNRLAASRT